MKVEKKSELIGRGGLYSIVALWQGPGRDQVGTRQGPGRDQTGTR